MFTAHLYARVRLLLLAHTAHETSGAARTRHSLRPLFSKGDNEIQDLGQNRAAGMHSHADPKMLE